MARGLPSGTVTFLFTDIEGSTRLLHELGDEAYAAALAEHRRIVRSAVAEHGGVEVDTQGDAFFVAFASASAATAAAVAARDELAHAGRIRVRMGLHTGAPHLTDEGYVGVDVHRAARIGACAHGGQIVMSSTTADAAALPDARPLGEHRLKDFDAAVPLFQVGDDVFPPLKTISNTNLPRPASSFLGREADVRAVVGLVEAGARLLTLTGPGGTGKTRLAVAVGTELVSSFPAGVFWVPLATVREPALVMAEISRVLGAHDGVAAHIADRQMLLVIDNLEQVVDAAPDLAALVEACPNLVLVATSRERLRVSAEVEHRVLPLPDDAAAELFGARAGVPVDDDVRALCRALDDLPLAIELAAARCAVMSPRQILDRLSRRLDLLRAGRDADPRQQTLRATIQWSYDLLDERTRDVFARLSTFRGGCTLDAAETVAHADIDDLQALVDKSVIRQSDDRFWLLETIREFGVEQLLASSDGSGVLDAHAAYYLELAERLEPAMRSFDNRAEIDAAEAELANVAAALDRYGATGRTQAALRMVGAIWWAWSWRGYVQEGRTRAAAALDADPTPTEARAAALIGAADLAVDAGDYDNGTRYAREALQILQPLGESWRSVYVRFLLGVFGLHEDDPLGAEDDMRYALDGFLRLGDRTMARNVRRRLAWMYERAGDRERSTQIHLDNLADARADGDRMMEATELSVLSGRAIDEQRYDEAVDLAGEALRIHLDLDARFDVVVDLHRFARVFGATGNAEPALLLVGVIEEAHRQRNVPVTDWIATHLDEVRAALAPVCTDEEASALVRRGARMTLEEAARLAVTSATDLQPAGEASTPERPAGGTASVSHTPLSASPPSPSGGRPSGGGSGI